MGVEGSLHPPCMGVTLCVAEKGGGLWCVLGSGGTWC